MLFKNTDEFSPVVKYGLTKAPRVTKEWREWWQEQRRRCLYGYTVNNVRITGPHYWYLNFWKIKRQDLKTKRKGLFPPRFLSLDYKFFHEFEKAQRKGKNFAVAKRRQCGFSEKIAAIIGWMFSLFPHSQSAVVAGEDKYADNTMGFVLRGLNELAGTEFFKRRSPDTTDYIKSSFTDKKQNGDSFTNGYLSEVFKITAKNNNEALSRLSPTLVVYEECGRFPNVRGVHGFVEPSLKAENNERTGMAIWIGTAGDIEAKSQDFKYICFNPDEFDILEYEEEESKGYRTKRKTAYFVPGTEFHIIDADGNSLIEESLKDLVTLRQSYIKRGKLKKLREIMASHPLSIDEMFMINEGGMFPADLLSSQTAAIYKHPHFDKIATRVHLEWIYDDKIVPGRPKGNIIGIEYQIHPMGEFLIFEFPRPGISYNSLIENFGGTDSYDKDVAPTSDSNLSTSIFNGRLKMFMARYTGRPLKAETAYENSAKLCYFYSAKNLIEYTNIRIFDWYEKMGLVWMLKEKPEIAYANAINSQAANKYGIEPSFKADWIGTLVDYTYDYYTRIYDVEMIDRFISFNFDKNCDITDAASISYLHYLDEQVIMESMMKKKEEPEKKAKMLHYKTVNGRMTKSM